MKHFSIEIWAYFARGALPAERCIDPDALFPELERRGNRIETVTEVLA